MALALIAGQKIRSNQIFHVLPPSIDVTAFSLNSPLAGFQVPRTRRGRFSRPVQGSEKMCCNFQGVAGCDVKESRNGNPTRDLQWRQTEPGIILCAVRWYLRHFLSLRDVEELLEERRLMVDHTTVWRWGAVFNTLASAHSRRSYGYAIERFIAWYCDEPRLAFIRSVVVAVPARSWKVSFPVSRYHKPSSFRDSPTGR